MNLASDANIMYFIFFFKSFVSEKYGQLKCLVLFSIFTETSQPLNVLFICNSDSNMCLTFRYHMYGSHIGTLNVYQMSALQLTLSGDQGVYWLLSMLNLDKNLIDFWGNTRVRFVTSHLFYFLFFGMLIQINRITFILLFNCRHYNYSSHRPYANKIRQFEMIT